VLIGLLLTIVITNAIDNGRAVPFIPAAAFWAKSGESDILKSIKCNKYSFRFIANEDSGDKAANTRRQ
jgi:hypothetical protein